MKIKTLALLTAALLIVPLISQAAPVKWTLVDVTFDDGGSATGSFVLDVDTGLLSDIAITTSINETLGLGTTYGVSSFGPYPGWFDTVTGFPATGESRLLFDFVAALTNAGGSVAINLFAGVADGELICSTDACSQPLLRTIVTGSVFGEPVSVSVPEPGTLALLGLGLVGIGLRRRMAKAG